MTTIVVRPDALAVPIGSALKNLAKVHDLPPFVKLYQSSRTAVVVVHRKYAEQWRAALGAGSFTEDREGGTSTWTAEVFWLGAQVRIVYGTHEGEA